MQGNFSCDTSRLDISSILSINEVSRIVLFWI
ncbi:hypothetical protein M086_1843, partial [Bacteroides fragilis str. S13 L11]